MRVAWISIREARRFIEQRHRHLPRIQGAIAALGLWVDGRLRGVVTIGRAARMDAPDVAVITRLCTDGCRNGCSRLYSKAKRLAQAFGFVGVKTFTRHDEGGASLLACGATEDGHTKPEHWSRTGRPRDTSDTAPRRRWQWGVTLDAASSGRSGCRRTSRRAREP